jgi:hypothetical protein
METLFKSMTTSSRVSYRRVKIITITRKNCNSCRSEAGLKSIPRSVIGIQCTCTAFSTGTVRVQRISGTQYSNLPLPNLNGCGKVVTRVIFNLACSLRLPALFRYLGHRENILSLQCRTFPVLRAPGKYIIPAVPLSSKSYFPPRRSLKKFN